MVTADNGPTLRATEVDAPQSWKQTSMPDTSQIGRSTTLTTSDSPGLQARLYLSTSRLEGTGSRPTTRPVGPTRWAKYRAVSPQQAPASTTMSPGAASMTTSPTLYRYCSSRNVL